jgi:hypothetical protein
LRDFLDRRHAAPDHDDDDATADEPGTGHATESKPATTDE